MISRRIGAIGAIAIMGLAVGAIWVTGRLIVTVPADAATTVLAHTVLTGPITPDASAGDATDSSPLPRSPSGRQCLERIERPAGPMDLCWEDWRDPADADPQQDYYLLRVYGSFGGASGTGVRWAVAGARLVGEPSNQVFQAWPVGVYEGACEQDIVAIGPLGIGSTPVLETLCGRTTATTSTKSGDWSQRVTWTCPSCLLPDQSTRSIALYEWMAVPEGTVPAWDIFGDLGG